MLITGLDECRVRQDAEAFYTEWLLPCQLPLSVMMDSRHRSGFAAFTDEPRPSTTLCQPRKPFCETRILLDIP
jgi:hypothetical protein